MAKLKKDLAAGLEPADEAIDERLDETTNLSTAVDGDREDQKDWSMTLEGGHANGYGGRSLSPIYNDQFSLGLSNSVIDDVKAKGGHVVVKWQRVNGNMQLRLTPGTRGYKLSNRTGRLKVQFPRRGVQLPAFITLDEKNNRPLMAGGPEAPTGAAGPLFISGSPRRSEEEEAASRCPLLQGSQSDSSTGPRSRAAFPTATRRSGR